MWSGRRTTGTSTSSSSTWVRRAWRLSRSILQRGQLALRCLPRAVLSPVSGSARLCHTPASFRALHGRSRAGPGKCWHWGHGRAAIDTLGGSRLISAAGLALLGSAFAVRRNRRGADRLPSLPAPPLQRRTCTPSSEPRSWRTSTSSTSSTSCCAPCTTCTALSSSTETSSPQICCSTATAT